MFQPMFDDQQNVVVISVEGAVYAEAPDGTVRELNPGEILAAEDVNDQYLSFNFAEGSTTINVSTTANSTTVSGSGSTAVQGQYGTLTIQADGSYSYIADDIDLQSDMVASWQFNEAVGSLVTDTGYLGGDAAIVTGGVSGNALQVNASDISVDNIVAAFGFGESDSANMSDLSPNNHTISMSGSASKGVGHNGQGGAFEMNGTTGHGEIEGLVTGGPMTISTWVRIDDFGNNYSRIIDFGDGPGDDNILLSHSGTGNGLTFHIYNGQGGSADGRLTVDNFFTAEEWVHVTATVDAQGVMSVYRNGELMGTQTDGAVPALMERNNNYIGRSHWSANGYLDGAVDDLMTVGEALTASEVSAVYQSASVEDLLSDGRVDINDSPEINIPADGVIETRTITLTFQPDSENSLSGRQVLYEEGGGANGLIVYIHDNTLYAGAYSNSSGWAGEFLSTSLSSLNALEFHRITLSLDSSSSTMTPGWMEHRLVKLFCRMSICLPITAQRIQQRLSIT